ncbi:MAG: CPBP family intramembrane metalloprotease [Phycisphaeraceae bacterium]|nr:CPBP family intramembrane metalloprotease [Phycisphaeraceae bacterium]
MTEKIRNSRAATAASAAKSEVRNPLTTYWQRSQRPLQALFFLLPLIICYEVASVLTAVPGEPRLPKIVAESLLGDFFLQFGVTGTYLPPIIVMVVLIAMHFTHRDHIVFEPKLYGFMAVESVAMAIPLFVFMLVLFRDPALQQAASQFTASATDAASSTSGGGGRPWYTGLVHALGAGIYEEMLFRLIAISMLHLLLVDVLAIPEHIGATTAVILSALAFALYHFPSLHEIDVSRFLFYSIAGIYFAAVYVLRGYGIVAATHAAYDVLVIFFERLTHA